jgi:CIC family chloride channel protein
MIDLPALPRPQPIRLVASLRRRMRTSEMWLVALAVGVGAAAGLAAVFQARIAHFLHRLLYGIGADDRLSAQSRVPLESLLWLPVGGLLLAAVSWLVARRRRAALVDVVEANALHGGVLGVVDSLIVCGQTLISNGFGASVGLEAAYAQAGGAMGSSAGRRLRLRRHDLRILLGAGSGAAMAAAFGAPLTGAFYAFEIVIGSYTPSAIAPVAAACLAGVLAASAAGGASYTIDIHPAEAPDLIGYLLFAGLGLFCAAVGIVIVLLVGRTERIVRASPIPSVLRPAIGGVLLARLALVSPQVLSAGHGALHLDLGIGLPLALLALIFGLKMMGSIVSLAFGFRGGLFFASLFLGSLLGQIYAGLLDLAFEGVRLSPENAALVGMGALGVAVVGGPLTMSFLVLESTRDFGVAAAALAASLVASTVVRERFGYSFSTWRLHLRGETIRSARDVGWMRSLTAGRMMRRDVKTLPASASVAEFRQRYPLGSTSRVILEDASGRYAGLVITALAYAEDLAPEAPVASVAISQDASLSPDMGVEAVMRAFDETETEELAVVDGERRVMGLLAETYVVRRYAQELERQQLELFGEARA